MIEAKNISKWFDGQRVLYDISAKFETGKTNLIIGQSGSGKTVFMKCLIGLLTPEEGVILYDGRQFRKMNTQEKRSLRTEIGMLFQGSALFDNETVLGNVMFPLKMFSPMSREEQLERAHFCINRVGLTNADDKYPSEISGGMQKRVSFARAIVTEPKIILYDEPTAGLDPISSTLIEDYIVRLKNETNAASIVVTHQMSTIRRTADSVLMLYNGHAVFEGTPEELMEQKTPYTKQFVTASIDGPMKMLG